MKETKAKHSDISNVSQNWVQTFPPNFSICINRSQQNNDIKVGTQFVGHPVLIFMSVWRWFDWIVSNKNGQNRLFEGFV